MFFGYNTNGFAHHRLEDIIKILAELGYGGLALTADFHTIDPLGEHWRERSRRIDRKLRDANMGLVIETGARFILDIRRKHQPTLLDTDRHKALDRLHFIEACIRLAADMDADAVSFWSGAAAEDSPPKIQMARLVEACLRLCDFAEGRKVRLAFEPEPGMFIDTMDKFADLQGKVNRRNFGLTLDVGHLQCNGELPIGEHIRRWKDWLWNVHIEDMKRGVHEHLMFGEGEIDFADVFAALREINYKRGLYVELSRHSHNAVEIARQALEFLKRFNPKRADSGRDQTVDIETVDNAEGAPPTASSNPPPLPGVAENPNRADDAPDGPRRQPEPHDPDNGLR